MPVVDLPLGEVVVGFCAESIVAALGGKREILLDVIKAGNIRGMGFVSCTLLRDSGQDVHSVVIAKELIKRNILILSLG